MTQRHKKPCSRCGYKPEQRRLKVQEGSGRSQRVYVYCEDCGDVYLDDRRKEYARAIRRLAGHDVNVRLDKDEQNL